jgi:ketosteroid isomerase-like protein
MTQENVEIVRGAYEAFNRGQVDGFLAAMHPDVQLVMSAEFPGPPVRHGHAGIRAFGDELNHVFDDYRLLPQSFREVGEKVLVAVRISGLSRATGIDSGANIFQVWTMRDGKATELRDFSSREEALEAVGLSEQDAHADS